MHKQEFLGQLRRGLSGLPQEDIEERLTFYTEMIEDRMEEGLSEEEAVSSVGSVDEIITQTVAETPLVKIAKERIKPKRELSAWEIVLLVLGSPIWLSMGIAVLSVIFSIYITLWSVIVSFWAIFGSLIACAFAGIAVGIGFALSNLGLPGLAMVGAGLICAGLAIFLFFGCKAATQGAVWLTKKIALGIKNLFIKKENI